MRFASVAPAPGAHHILWVQAGGGGEISAVLVGTAHPTERFTNELSISSWVW